MFSLLLPWISCLDLFYIYVQRCYYVLRSTSSMLFALKPIDRAIKKVSTLCWIKKCTVFTSLYPNIFTRGYVQKGIYIESRSRISKEKRGDKCNSKIAVYSTMIYAGCETHSIYMCLLLHIYVFTTFAYTVHVFTIAYICVYSCIYMCLQPFFWDW